MSIWTKGRSAFMFEAGKGKEFAKKRLQQQYDKNRRANEERSIKLGQGSSNTRRQRGRAKQSAEQCYKIHDAIPKNAHLKPFITPPKAGGVNSYYFVNH